MISRETIQAAWPEGGLFTGKGWLLSPEPFRLDSKAVAELERMGPVLSAFQMAQDRIYRRSAKGSEAPWLAKLLDVGKPEWMVDWQRQGSQAEVTPRVIRPDLLLTNDGFAIAELDSVPGGLGVTAWLGSLYGEVVGGADGILRGLQAILPENREVWISQEAADYRPEMEWLCQQIDGLRVRAAEDWSGEAGYRFFELFDWEDVPGLESSESKGGLTPPIKPHFEEKLWLALLHTPGLRKLWQQELRGKYLDHLRAWIPQSWVVDPAPLPPQAVLPQLGVNSWHEVGAMSQKERRLVLKISGFSELAWGSRGVYIGHDEPGSRWAELIETAGQELATRPWMMQQFSDGKVIEHPYFDSESGEVRTMKGRVRLCPYYFTTRDSTTLGGCLATIVPADKKKIHGMEDAILVPVALAEDD